MLGVYLTKNEMTKNIFATTLTRYQLLTDLAETDLPFSSQALVSP